MIYLRSSGTVYGIGFEHGALYPEAVQLACQALGTVTGVEDSLIDMGARIAEERLRRFFPQTLEEMQGIADGSGLSLRQILTLNCMLDIMGSAIDGLCCSNIGFADSDVGVLLGKTADWGVTGAENFAAWQRYQPAAGEGHTFIHYGCAGTLWTEGGLNDAGLGMVLNGLPVSGSTPDGLPWLPLPRGVLQHCRNVQEAIDFLGRYDMMCWGFNLTLADASGDLAFIEVVPGAQAVRRSQEDYLIHTNHCLCSETAVRQVDDEGIARYGYPGLLQNSLARYQTLKRIVPPARRTVNSMKNLLRDRCAAGPISQNGEHGLRTVYAMIVAPAQGKMWGAEDYPPNVPFVEYQV